MTQNFRNLLRAEIQIPKPGKMVRVRKGPLELILQRQRGALCLLTKENPTNSKTNGGNAPVNEQRHYLGLPREGSLVLEAKAPEFRVQVQLLDAVTLAPGGRLHGYVTVPLPHRLMWLGKRGRTDALLDVMPKELRTGWHGEGENGGYVHETKSTFRVFRDEVPAVLSALVPVILRNVSGQTLSPTKLLVSLRDRDLRQLGRAIVAAPRRIDLLDEKATKERLRALPRARELA